MRKSIEYNNGGSAGFIYADCITNIFIDDSENCIYNYHTWWLNILWSL